MNPKEPTALENLDKLIAEFDDPFWLGGNPRARGALDALTTQIRQACADERALKATGEKLNRINQNGASHKKAGFAFFTRRASAQKYLADALKEANELHSKTIALASLCLQLQRTTDRLITDVWVDLNRSKLAPELEGHARNQKRQTQDSHLFSNPSDLERATLDPAKVQDIIRSLEQRTDSFSQDMTALFHCAKRKSFFDLLTDHKAVETLCASVNDPAFIKSVILQLMLSHASNLLATIAETHRAFAQEILTQYPELEGPKRARG